MTSIVRYSELPDPPGALAVTLNDEPVGRAYPTAEGVWQALVNTGTTGDPEWTALIGASGAPRPARAGEASDGFAGRDEAVGALVSWREAQIDRIAAAYLADLPDLQTAVIHVTSDCGDDVDLSELAAAAVRRACVFPCKVTVLEFGDEEHGPTRDVLAAQIAAAGAAFTQHAGDLGDLKDPARARAITAAVIAANDVLGRSLSQ